MKGWQHVPGKGCTVFCRSCEDELPGGPWATSTEAFAAMAEHGWHKGPDVCFECGNAYGAAEAAGLVSFRKGDPWDFVHEIAPGVWVEKPAPVKRKRRIKLLL